MILTHAFRFLCFYHILHTRSPYLLLTWPFSKTSPIWSRNVFPLQHYHLNPLHSLLSISFQPFFLHDQTILTFVSTSSFTLHSSLITSFLTLSLNFTPIILLNVHISTAFILFVCFFGHTQFSL
jgi:hypothetical protein